MTKEQILGIDIGTSAIKSVLFDQSGNELSISRRQPEIDRPFPGWSEVAPLTVWRLVKETIREVTAKSASLKGKVIAIGVSGVCCGSWLVDEDVNPVRNAILWNDGRAADIITDWSRSGVMDEIFRIGGNLIFPGYTLSVLKWVAENEPGSLADAKHSIYCKDYIRYRLTGDLALDHSDAAYMPYDLKAGTISKELLDVVGLSDSLRLFPKLIEPDSIAGFLLDDVAKELGLPKGIPVIGGLVDVAATTLGAGAWRLGQACSIIGTSNLNSIILEKPSFEPFGIGVQTRTTGGMFVKSLVNTSGTLGLQWFIDEFCQLEKVNEERRGRSVFAWAEDQINTVPIGSDGIIYHPYINSTGVISPFFNPAARAQFFGISIEHTKKQMLRAVYEGTALAIHDCYSQMPVEIDQVYISGGGARSSTWSQMIADATGKSILVSKGDELGAKGVAILAGIASGLYPSLKEAVNRSIHVEREFTPNPKAHSQFNKVYDVYRKIYKDVNESWWARYAMLQKLRK